jgi:hypothetical protein
LWAGFFMGVETLTDPQKDAGAGGRRRGGRGGGVA